MYNKLVSGMVIGLLLNLLCYVPVAAHTTAEASDKFVAKVKNKIAKLGTGPDARIEVQLRDKTKVKGYLSEVSADSFVIVEAKTGKSLTVTYPQVKKVKGNNLSTGAKIAIGVGIVIGVLLLFGLIAAKSGD